VTAGAGGSTTTGGGGGAGGSPEQVTNNGFPGSWGDGTQCGSAADVDVWEYAADTFILRQSLCTHYEAPFIYVMFGRDAVLVQDTGTGDANIYAEVASLVATWEGAHGTTLDVWVTHSHAHGDHVGGDGQFQGKPSTTVVGGGVSSVMGFFGMSAWPDEAVELDLGERVIDVMAIPGHQSSHVAVFDRRHQLLLTGDTIYPGRLYIDDFGDYRDSIQRLVDFSASHPVSWILGTHIEMRASGGDYAFGADQHPDEHVLQLPTGVLDELHQALVAMGNDPQYEEHADFIIYP
jgi:glyoxylase-like metal-dependent hydrolase (beta-lactamase superfamily II)